MLYTVHKVPPGNPARDNPLYSIRDEHDNAMGFSYDPAHAALIAQALGFMNLYTHPKLTDQFHWVWTCGHTAGAHCAQCYTELAQRAHKLAVQLLEDGGENEQRTKDRT